jgi:hypothetical protein
MYFPRHLLALVIGCLLSGSLQQVYAQQDSLARAESLRKQFRQQLTASCEQGMQLEKTVINQLEGTEETHTWPVDEQCFPQIQGEKAEYNLQASLQDAVERLYIAPRVAQYMTARRAGGRLIAEVRPSDTSDARLWRQVIEREGDTFRYIESQVVRKSVLYDHYVRVRVWFDTQKRLDRYSLQIKTRIPFYGIYKHLKIQGRAHYDRAAAAPPN